MEKNEIVKYDMNSKKFPFKNGDLVGHVCWGYNEKRFCLERNGIKYWSVSVVTDSKNKEGIMLLAYSSSFSLSRMGIFMSAKEMDKEDIYYKIE